MILDYLEEPGNRKNDLNKVAVCDSVRCNVHSQIK